MSRHAMLVRIALVFGIVGQTFGISIPATARDQSAPQAVTQSRPAAISPLSSPLTSPGVTTPLSSTLEISTEVTSTPDDTVIPLETASQVTLTTESMAVTAGKTVSLAQGHLQMQTSASTEINAVHLSVITATNVPALASGIAFGFEITATDRTQQQVSHFTSPVTFTLVLGDLVRWTDLPYYLHPWVGYYDEDAQQWQPITPTLIDQENGVVIFATNHFSTYGAGNSGVTEAGWVPTYNDATVDEFSGALSWKYDFDLPSGPGGIQPSLNLNYNSRRMDGLLSASISDGEGYGWQLDVPQIEWRGVHYSFGDYLQAGFPEWENSLILTANGVSVRVVPTSTDYMSNNKNWMYQSLCGEPFAAEDDQIWRIRWVCGASGQGHPEGDYWEITLKDGTRYILGNSDDSRQTMDINLNYTWTKVNYRWLVKQIVYPNGVTVNYTYNNYTYMQQCSLWATYKTSGQPSCDITSSTSFSNTEREITLNQIDYPGVRVRFDWDLRSNGNGPPDYGMSDHQFLLWQLYALQGITVEQQLTGTAWTPSSAWRLHYGSVNVYGYGGYPAARVLERLQPYGTDGNALPATTFGYIAYHNKGGDLNGCFNAPTWNCYTFKSPRLTRIDNGYGGVITATYETKDEGNWHAWNYRLASRQTSDGQAGGSRIDYTYSTARCYRSESYPDWINDVQCDPANWFYNSDATKNGKPGGSLLGYQAVTQTVQDLATGTGLKQVISQFTQPSSALPASSLVWDRIGKPITTTTYSPNNSLLQQTVEAWAHTIIYQNVSCYVLTCHYRVGRSWLTSESTTQGGRTTRTSYDDDAYGNIARETDDGFIDVTGDERIIVRNYAYNTNDWILDKPYQEAIYENAEQAGNLKLRTRYYYDNAAYTTAPAKGLLTRQEQGTDTLSVAQATGYDSWSNPVLITDALGYTRTAVYDPWNHSRVLTQTNALGQRSLNEYYGINERTASGSGLAGSLKTTYDANGVATGYAYDAFGRLASVVKPGDSYVLPTLSYTYSDVAFTQTVYQAIATSYHQTGTLDSTNGGWKSYVGNYTNPYASTYLTYGPYATPARIGPGQTARFRLALQAEAVMTDKAVAKISVDDSTTGEELAARTLVDRDFRITLNRPSDFDLTFDTIGRAGHSLEYRVLWLGRGQIEHYTTTLLWTFGQPLKIETQQREVSGCESCVQVSQAYYNGLGQAIQQRSEAATSAQQVVVDTIYDGLGRVAQTYVPTFTASSTSFARPNGWDSRPKVQTQYDALGRTVAVTNADGSVTQMGYLGMTTLITDANGHRKDSVADAYGRLQAVVEYSGTTAYTTTYQYDILGNLRVVTDALGNTTVITYDALSRKVGMRDPDMGTWTYAYDANGNLITQTDALGQTAWFGYDKLNRLVEKRQGSSSGPVLAQYEYDQGMNSIGHRSAMTNTNAMMRWTYDVRGRAAAEVKTFTGVTGTFGSIWQYDALDRVTQTRLPNGEMLTTTYNAAGQATGLKAGSQMLVSSATYSPLGQPTRIDYANQTSTRYRYFGLNANPGWINQNYGRVRQICVNAASAGDCFDDGVTGETATILLNLVYWYDNVGNVNAQQDRSPGQGDAVAYFAYDPLDRLVGVASAYAQTYSYNAIGNFITKAGITQVYSTTQPHAVRSLSNGSSFQYDANGNMTQRTEMSGTQLITYQQQWDIDNRLVAVTNTNTGQVTQYFYDADGNRVKRVGPQGTTVYVNADYEVTGPSQMVMPSLPPTYTHKLYLPVVACAGCNGIAPVSALPMNLASARVTYRFNGQQVAVREGVTLTFIYGDHLGSASVTANLSGTKVSEVRYYPFGETHYSNGSLPSDRTFTGQRAESQSAVGNLMDYGARFYSPILGRFISADSIVPQPGNPQSTNRYAYTLNNPLNYIDPSGHDVGCAGEDMGTYCGSPIPLRAWDENGQKLSSDEQKRAIAAYVSLTEDPDLWAKLYSDPKAWDASGLPIDLMLYMWGTGLSGFTAEALVYTRLGEAGPALNEQRSANFEKEYGYTNGFLETTALLSPDILGTAAMIWTNRSDFVGTSKYAARREAFRRFGVSTTEANNYTSEEVYGRNTNLRGPNGEPYNEVKALDVNGNEVTIEDHQWGHTFTDVNPSVYEGPHYHGPNGEHIFYP